MHFRVLWARRRWAVWLFLICEGLSVMSYFVSVLIIPNTFDKNFFFSAPFWRDTILISLGSTVPAVLMKVAEQQVQECLLTRRTHRKTLW